MRKSKSRSSSSKRDRPAPTTRTAASSASASASASTFASGAEDNDSSGETNINSNICTSVMNSNEGSTAYVPSIAESLALGRGRRRGAQATKCPICLKTFYRAVMSIADINDHINRCSDAQFWPVAQKLLSPASKKLKIDVKGNVITKVKELETARAESMKVLKEGPLKQSFESLLLKHLE